MNIFFCSVYDNHNHNQPNIIFKTEQSSNPNYWGPQRLNVDALAHSGSRSSIIDHDNDRWLLTKRLPNFRWRRLACRVPKLKTIQTPNVHKFLKIYHIGLTYYTKLFLLLDFCRSSVDPRLEPPNLIFVVVSIILISSLCQIYDPLSSGSWSPTPKPPTNF